MTAAGGAVMPNARTGAPAWLTALGTSTALWVFGVDIILVLVFGLLSPDRAFLSARAFQALGLDASEGLILATGIALLLGAGEIDLSLGANLLLSSVVGAKIIVSFGGGSTTSRNRCRSAWVPSNAARPSASSTAWSPRDSVWFR